MRLSNHAARRTRQWNISPDGVDAALLWGSCEYQSCHRQLFIVDRRSVEKARDEGEDIRRFRDVLVIVGADGTVISVGRYRNTGKIHWRRQISRRPRPRRRNW